MSGDPELTLGRRPWTALYPRGVPAELVPHHQNVLAQFRAQVATRPEATALWYFDCQISFRTLDQRSDAAALWMRSRGVGAGDRVSLIYQNSPEFIIVTLAAWKIGAIPTPSNPAYRSGELTRIFLDCEPAAVFCEASSHAEVHAALVGANQIGTPIVISSLHPQAPRSSNSGTQPPQDAIRLDQLIAEPQCVLDAPANIDPAGIGLLLYTSGTTGMPKGAMLRHSSLAFNAEALARWCELGAQSRILAIAPFFHITGFVCHMGAAFACGALLIMHYRFDPQLVLEVIRRTKPTYTIGAITAFNALMSTPGAEAADMSSFDRIYSGGAPIPPAVAEAFRAKFGIPIGTCYGMTETAAPTHFAPHGLAIPVDPQSGVLAIGIPFPSTEAVCVDDEGKPLPPGAAGELLLRGPQVMAGYFNKPEDSAAALADGWMHSGDVAFQDHLGWFYLVDRKKDVIIASGFKIWPREVEDVLYSHPAVREAAVVGIPDAYRGENVKAYVSLRQGSVVDGRVLIAHCRESLASYKVPRFIEVLDELPKTISGKIQRAALRTRT